MEHLLNLLYGFADAISWLIPVFCYLGGIIMLMLGTLKFVEAGKDSRNGLIHAGVSASYFVVGFTLLSFDEFLNIGTRTLGGSTRASIGGSLLSHPIPGALALGGTPQDSFLAAVALFSVFTKAFGALMCLKGLMKLRASGKQQGPSTSSAFVHLFFGFVLLNTNDVAAAIVNRT